MLRGYVEVIQAYHRPGRKAYFWRIPPELSGKISEGDNCLVQTVKGVKRVTVEKVLYWQYPQQEPRLRVVIKLV